MRDRVEVYSQRGGVILIGLNKQEILKMGVGLEYGVLERVAAIIEANNAAIEKQLPDSVKKEISSAK